MADPVSVAGGAVGVLSLSIQVCERLVWFITNVKDAKDKTAQIHAELDSLADLLELLESIIGKLNPSGSVSATRSGIEACAEAIKKIRTKISDQSNANDSKLRFHIKRAKQRLAYPFKQEDIMHWKGVVESIQQSLHTALLALQIDQQRQDVASIRQQIDQESSLGRMGNQFAIQQQTLYHNQTSLQLKDQTQLVKSCFQESHTQLATVNTTIANMQDTLSPVVIGASHMPTVLPELVSSMSRLEAKVDLLNLQSVSPTSLGSDISEYHSISRKFGRLNTRPTKPKRANMSCSCQPQSQLTTYLNWPISLVRNQTVHHDATCEFSVHQAAITDMNLRLTICSMALRRKANVAFAISVGAGCWRVQPSLEVYQVVPRSSPAFQLLDKFLVRARITGRLDSSNVWRETADELYKLFETRQASPNDRLVDNGRTMLHYICSYWHKRPEFNGSNFQINAMCKWILGFLPTIASEKDEHGFTCNDYALLRGWDVWKLFLEYGITISTKDYLDLIDWDFPTYKAFANNFPDEMWDCPKRLRIMLMQSETALRALLEDGVCAQATSEDGISLFHMATRLNWREGCEVLHEHRIRITTNFEPLLSEAIRYDSLEALKFWLHVRQNLDDASLAHVGDLEEALDAVSIWRRGDANRLHTIVSALVQQRRQLQSIVDPVMAMTNSVILIDAQALTIIRIAKDREIAALAY
ncbi:hypothetical protein BDV95DRAFT_604162 [Massariosphaeria phaeospora]|uniref:Azaphilone pigments biosynthesis cluster protein L N-terminal domain-containing protein n=1 Tax=Massariosphaeria phaeospora TaxID=100035 RepID=A0A7C8MD01_9PLEO|nr:hypothetical protein BDV95DRAFT_604162 [Massariosphaeria phaeospora]